ncbi:MAG: hypothetical protein KatS3mg025_0515 [Bacteroidia bacterium]|nr:MAG: hypothetical protein KatS3mg025_0515 [Bacteroidia bacterium]
MGQAGFFEAQIKVPHAALGKEANGFLGLIPVGTLKLFSLVVVLLYGQLRIGGFSSEEKRLSASELTAISRGSSKTSTQRSSSSVRQSPTQEAQEVAFKIFERINAERRKAGLGPLVWCEDVARAAENHSQNMAKRQFFDHEDPIRGNVGVRLRRLRIAWSTCGENIFMSTYKGRYIVERAVQGWMSSPGHRENILDREFTHTGIGVFYDEREEAYYVTQIFMRPPADKSTSVSTAHRVAY